MCTNWIKHGAAEHSSVCRDKCCDMKLEWGGRAVSGVWDLALHLLRLGPDGFCQICVYRSSTTPSSTYSRRQLLRGVHYLPTIRKKETTSMMMNLYWAAERFLCPQTITCDPTVMWEEESFFFTNVTEMKTDTEKALHELLQQDSRTEEEEQEDNTLCKWTGQSKWITSENHFMTGDYSADSFCVATIIQFYDLLKLNGQGRRLAAHASRRYRGSMQKNLQRHCSSVKSESSGRS